MNKHPKVTREDDYFNWDKTNEELEGSIKEEVRGLIQEFEEKEISDSFYNAVKISGESNYSD